MKFGLFTSLVTGAFLVGCTHGGVAPTEPRNPAGEIASTGEVGSVDEKSIDETLAKKGLHWEEGIICSSDENMENGITIVLYIDHKTVKITEKYRGQKYPYTSVTKNPEPDQQSIDKYKGDVTKGLYLLSGKHNHSVELIVTPAMGVKNSASGVTLTKGVVIVSNEANGGTGKVTETNFRVSCGGIP